MTSFAQHLTIVKLVSQSLRRKGLVYITPDTHLGSLIPKNLTPVVAAYDPDASQYLEATSNAIALLVVLSAIRATIGIDSEPRVWFRELNTVSIPGIDRGEQY